MRTKLTSLLSISPLPNRNRILFLAGTLFFIYVSTLIGLLYAWYQVDANVPFHWFDDSKGWLMVDKFGHFFTAFIECSIIYRFWIWTGLPHMRCLLIAAGIALVAQSSYEIFDGFSAGYGASVTDILANLAGVTAVVLQFVFFKRLLLASKFSFHTTAFAYLRPTFFGDNVIQQILKDYNGQTYWYTLDINGLVKKNILPKWLFISVGYGGDGLLGGDDNIWTDKSGVTHDYSHIARSSRIMFSFDFNWEMISDKRLKSVCHIFNYMKFPAPTLEFHFIRGIRFYWIYF